MHANEYAVLDQWKYHLNIEQIPGYRFVFWAVEEWKCERFLCISPNGQNDAHVYRPVGLHNTSPNEQSKL